MTKIYVKLNIKILGFEMKKKKEKRKRNRKRKKKHKTNIKKIIVPKMFH